MFKQNIDIYLSRVAPKAYFKKGKWKTIRRGLLSPSIEVTAISTSVGTNLAERLTTSPCKRMRKLIPFKADISVEWSSKCPKKSCGLSIDLHDFYHPSITYTMLN